MTAVSSVSSCMHWIRGCIIILLLTILDQGSKSLVLAQLKDQPDISLIPGVLQLRYLENRGMAFGLFEGKIPVFVILCLLFFGVFIYVYARIPKNRYYLPLSVTALVMVSGALGNFIDRVCRGYVVDFIYFSLIDFPVFNIADMYVVCSGILLVMLVCFRYKNDEDYDFLSIMEILNYQVSDGQSGIRIDRYLSEMNEELSRSYIQKLLKEQKITVNGSAVKANYKVQEGDEISVAVPDIKEPDILPEDIPLDILYEDDDVLIVNKPKGMVVHPSAGHTSGTLVNAIMFHCKDNLSGINGVLRPGIVHRIDKDTTGALLVCKNDNAHRNLAEQLKEHSIRRRYRAIVAGVLKEDEGTIEGPIGRHPIDRKKMAVNYKNGKDAVTHYKVLERFKNATYVECRLETGRTHQIRVHMTSIGHPLLGDEVYGSGKNPYHLQGQTLHAMILGFVHPSTGEYMEFTAPLPEYFVKLLEKLRK